MKLQSELDECNMELSNARNSVVNHELALNDRIKHVDEQNKTIQTLKTENLALRNDISLIKSKLENTSNTTTKEIDSMNEILASKKNVLGEKEQELSRVKMELDSRNLEQNRLQISQKYALDDLKLKEDEVNKLTEKNQILNNELLNGKLSRMELEHETKASKGKHSELVNEIEIYKKELEDLKDKCS